MAQLGIRALCRAGFDVVLNCGNSKCAFAACQSIAFGSVIRQYRFLVDGTVDVAFLFSFPRFGRSARFAR